MTNSGLLILDNNGLEILQDAYSELVELWMIVGDNEDIDAESYLLDRSAIQRLSRLLAGYGIPRAKLERRREAQLRRKKRTR